jgi:hypothetical protein
MCNMFHRFTILIFFVAVSCSSSSTPEERYRNQCKSWKDAMNRKAITESTRVFNRESGEKYYRYCVDPSPADLNRIMQEITSNK